VLVGGPTRAQRVDAGYIDALCDRLAAWHGRDGGGLLVSTSRRTPAALAARLRERLARLPARVWTGDEDGPNPYLGMLAHAQRLVVTPDSANLLAEACATGKPVFVFARERVRGKLGALQHDLLVEGRIRPMREAPTDWTVPPVVRDLPRIAAEVRRRFEAARGAASG
jgi:mitochondrial fission protein ELM1